MLSPVAQAIVDALKYGPLDESDLAETTDIGAVALREQLRMMQRSDRPLVRLGRGQLWRLTDRGYDEAWGYLQTTFVFPPAS